MAIDTTSRRSRRAMLGAGLGAIAATAASALGGPGVAEAASSVVLGAANTETTTTSIANTTANGTGVSGIANTGPTARGVYGQSIAGRGVEGSSSSGLGVYGHSGTWRGVQGNSSSGVGVFGTSTSGYGVQGESSVDAGVYGHSSLSNGVMGRSPSSGASGVYGENTSTTNGYGVAGRALGSGGHGVYGECLASQGTGVSGLATGSGGDGVYGSSASGVGVHGVSTSGSGVHGESASTGVYGHSTAHGDGVLGASEASAWAGVYGLNGASLYGYGVIGVVSGTTSYGVFGESSGEFGSGLYGNTQLQTGTGVAGYATNGGYAVNATATGGGRAIYGAAWGTGGIAVSGIQDTGATLAGYFDGAVTVTGTLTSAAPIIQLDNPDAPADRYYQQATVGSFEQVSIISGNAATGADGKVTVKVPLLFARYHRDIRYVLTPLGAAVLSYVARRLDAKGTFVIATDQPGTEVSWLLTGVRSDPAALKQPLRVDAAKPARYRGRYVQPALYGQPRSKSLVARKPPKAPHHPKAAPHPR